MAVIKHLFGLISQGDSEMMRIFFAWIQNSGLREISKVSPS
jgi:hypothetical protein